MRTVESIAEVGRDDSGPWLRVESAPDGLTRSRRKLQEIVRRAYQRPLGGYLANASQQKLAKFPPLLDLTKHGLDRLLSQPVATAPTKLLPHRMHPRAQLNFSFSGCCRLPVFLTARGDVAVDVTPAELLQIVFRTIPGASCWASEALLVSP